MMTRHAALLLSFAVCLVTALPASAQMFPGERTAFAVEDTAQLVVENVLLAESTVEAGLAPAVDDGEQGETIATTDEIDAALAAIPATGERLVADTPIEIGSEAPDVGSLGRLFLGAGLVLFAGWLMVRKQRRGGAEDGQMLRHVQTLRLGAKQHVSIVEVDGKSLLLGVTDHRVEVLSELEAVARQPQETPRESPSTFGGMLRRALGRNQLVVTDEIAPIAANHAPRRRSLSKVVTDAVKPPAPLTRYAGNAESQESEKVLARLESLRRQARQ